MYSYIVDISCVRVALRFFKISSLRGGQSFPGMGEKDLYHSNFCESFCCCKCSQKFKRINVQLQDMYTLRSTPGCAIRYKLRKTLIARGRTFFTEGWGLSISQEEVTSTKYYSTIIHYKLRCLGVRSLFVECG